MFSKLGFRIAFIATIAIFASTVAVMIFGGGLPMGNPQFVSNIKISSPNPFDRGCTMTLKDWKGNEQTFQAYTGDCYENGIGTSVYILNGRVYEY